MAGVADTLKRPLQDDSGGGDPGAGQQIVKVSRTDDANDVTTVKGNGPPVAAEVRDRLDDLVSRGLVQEGALDAKVLRKLSEYHPEVAKEAIEQFASHDLTKINNKSAYLSSVLARFPKQLGPRQPEEVQQFLDQAFRDGSMRVTDLDGRCYEALAGLPPHAALRMLDKFAFRDKTEVRNMSAFFMTMLKQATLQGDLDLGRRGPGMGRMPEPYGGRAPMPVSPYGRGPPPPMGVPPSVPLPMPGGPPKKNYGIEQSQMGVRTNELHDLSVFAIHVHPAPALKLQQLWDNGNRLVSLLDDRAWEALGSLEAPEALAVVEEVARTMDEKPIRNVNAFFMSVANKYLDKNRMGGRGQEPGPMIAARQPIGGGGYGRTQPPRGYGGQPAPYGDSPRSRPGSYASGRSADGWNPKEPGPGLDSLSQPVRERVLNLIAERPGSLKENDFDSGVVEALKRLDEGSAMSVIDELANNDIGAIRNIPAFVMGICKRKRGRH